jgi:hypothetical protein
LLGHVPTERLIGDVTAYRRIRRDHPHIHDRITGESPPLIRKPRLRNVGTDEQYVRVPHSTSADRLRTAPLNL